MTHTEVDASPSPASRRDHAGATEFRYPGSPPFADTELSRLVFHGRSREIDEVLHSILSFDLFLVYAVSGLGKTSLLSAGVFERLRQRGLFPVMIRLNDPSISPVDLIDAQLREAGAGSPSVTVMRHPAVDAGDATITTLWDLLATLEIWRDNVLQRPVLVFDQFEELFTLEWGDARRQDFIAQLGQVIRRRRPAPSEPSDGPLASLPPPDVKITIIIREDFVGELEALAADVPQIMAHRFRLDGLQPDQARAAICTPAEVDDDRLATRRFRYTEGAAHTIVDFLDARESAGRSALKRSIDPCQLQIICQHVERSILADKEATLSPDEIAVITEDDLGGRDGLEQILSDFYRRELAAFQPRQRKLVRELCETGLINQNQRRLSLEEGEIVSRFGVSKEVLDELVARRLLRSEPRVGSVYYELAHDSLTMPILAHRESRRAARRRRWRRWILGSVGVALVAAAGVVLAGRAGDDAGDEPEVEPRQVDISSGEQLRGSMSANVFDFSVETSQTIAIDVTPDDDEFLAIEVTYPGGATEHIDSESGAGLHHVVAAPIGDYRVEVDGPDEVTFGLTIRPTAVTALEVDQPITDRVVGDRRQTYLVEPPLGQPIELTATPDAGLDIALEVTGPDGVVVTTDNGIKGVREVYALSGATPGPFRVVVYGFDGSGAFELTATTIELVPVDVGKAVTGRIEDAGDIAVIHIHQPPGALALLELTPGPSLDGVIEVAGATFATETSDDSGPGGRELAVVAEVPDVAIRVVVRGYNESTGAFQLATRPIRDTALTVGVPADGSLDEAEPVALYAISLEEVDRYTLELTADDELEAAAIVLSEDLSPLMTLDADDPQTGELQPGSYKIAVYSDANTTGPFQLTVTQD